MSSSHVCAAPFIVLRHCQVILLLQTNVTARVELENRLADLTDAQLGMLEQLFPRHVIEYMLSHKHGYNSQNLLHLANQHENVVVLFTDVVGFTSMSKEVHPSEVRQAGTRAGGTLSRCCCC